jgi:hypothetical protein
MLSCHHSPLISLEKREQANVAKPRTKPNHSSLANEQRHEREDESDAPQGVYEPVLSPSDGTLCAKNSFNGAKGESEGAQADLAKLSERKRTSTGFTGMSGGLVDSDPGMGEKDPKGVGSIGISA